MNYFFNMWFVFLSTPLSNVKAQYRTRLIPDQLCKNQTEHFELSSLPPTDRLLTPDTGDQHNIIFRPGKKKIRGGNNFV